MNKKLNFKITQSFLIGSENRHKAYNIKGKTSLKIIDCRNALKGSLENGCGSFTIRREFPFGITVECYPYYILTLNANGYFMLTGIPKGMIREFVETIFNDIIERGKHGKAVSN